ncbi:hypothetical protein [Sunxiuqinia rutila]|uniref:hypothetical protein n=1 Tax=Sunxiuqinia rutila TaxID=1397841 RepID=UPI003D36448A
MRTIYVLLFLVLTCCIGLKDGQAQRDYRTAIGFRAGPMAGLTVRQFVSSSQALELSIASRWNGSLYQAIYEVHNDLFKQKRFNWYYGGGAYIGHWNLKSNLHPWYSEDGKYTAFGINAIGGLEYCINDAPISFSLDWKPMLNMVNKFHFRTDDFGLTIRVFLGEA